MSSKYDIDDALSLAAEFEFESQRGFKRFVRDSCNVADREGTEAARRFEAVKLIGERIQAMRVVSNKHLRNIYRVVMDQVVAEYGYTKSQEPLLKDMLLVYWKHGPDLRAALGPKAVPAKPVLPTTVQASWDGAVNPADHNAVETDGHDYYPDHASYRTSREAGM